MNAQWLTKRVVALSSRAAILARKAFARALVAAADSMPSCHHCRGKCAKS